MWSKKDTDQLFDLCERFDLRFVVIADRFSSSRTVEELKDRYYSGTFAIFCCVILVTLSTFEFWFQILIVSFPGFDRY